MGRAVMRVSRDFALTVGGFSGICVAVSAFLPLFTIVVTDPIANSGTAPYKVACYPFFAVNTGHDGEVACRNAVFGEACWNVIQATNTNTCGTKAGAHVSVDPDFYTAVYYGVCLRMVLCVLTRAS